MIVEVIFTEEAEKAFQKIKTTNPTLLRSINQKIEILKKKPHFGQPIAKKKIPKEYLIKHSTKNIFIIELSGYWRLIYTITNEELIIIALVIDILDHKQYDKKLVIKP